MLLIFETKVYRAELKIAANPMAIMLRSQVLRSFLNNFIEST